MTAALHPLPLMPLPDPSRSSERKHPEIFGFLVAWLEERPVSQQEIDLLLPTHRNGWLRPQIEPKLAYLDLTRPLEADLHHRVVQALELFEAIHSRQFPAPTDWDVLEPWLQRALAYFVKCGDAIPDHFADGYEDDHREFAEMAKRLGVVLDRFELWRRHQRPR